MDTVTDARGVLGVGYEGKSLDAFIHGLLASGTRVVVDVRLTPISRKSGFSKRVLAAALADAGICYLHVPQLGNPVWNRRGFAGTAEEVEAARARFGGMLDSDEASAAIRQIAETAASAVVAVMCVEADDRSCHRYVILNEVHRQSQLNPDLSPGLIAGAERCRTAFPARILPIRHDSGPAGEPGGRGSTGPEILLPGSQGRPEAGQGLAEGRRCAARQW
jgi:Protein of unknown function, DUF488